MNSNFRQSINYLTSRMLYEITEYQE